MLLLDQSKRARPTLEALEDRIVPAAPDITFFAEELTGNQIRITGIVMDEDPSSVSVQISGVATGQATADSAGNFAITTTATGTGSLTGVATDSEQLTSTAYEVFDSSAPSVSFAVFQSGNGPGEVTISGTVTDEQAAGRTVFFTGAVTGNVVTDSEGNFSVTTIASATGDVTANVSDPWGLQATPDVQTLENLNPEITYFAAVDNGNNVWTFEGYVSDEYAPGLTVRLGGIASLNNQTVTVDLDGYFSITLTLNPNETGTVWAETTDWFGADSNTALDTVN